MTHNDNPISITKCESKEIEEGLELLNGNCLDKIPTRFMIFFLSLTAMISSFLMRSIMPITILAMVKDEPNNKHHHVNSNQKCFNQSTNSTTIRTDYGGTLEWSIDIQYYILTSFYWTYIIAQVLGGIISQKFGTKIVVGYAFLTSSVCNICIPLAAKIHYGMVILLQVAQGLGQGLVWPALYGFISSWVPVHERSRFVTNFQGMGIGVTVGQVMSGFVISKFGWSYVFFIAGGIGMLWCLVWYFLAYNTPESHPRISLRELTYIKKNRGFFDKKRHNEIPWRSIVLSGPVWAIAITSFGRMWLNLTIAIYGSLFLKTVIGLDIESNGLWSGLPSTVCLFASFFFSYISDKLFINNYLSLLKIRKLFSGISQVIPGILAICFGYLNCNISLILTVWCILQIIATASFAGSMVNVLDITPNFSGPVIGFIQIFLMLPSIVGSYVTKTIMQNQSIINTWQTIFNIAGAIDLVSFLIYCIFASAKVQSWDTKSNTNEMEKDTELKDRILLK